MKLFSNRCFAAVTLATAIALTSACGTPDQAEPINLAENGIEAPPRPSLGITAVKASEIAAQVDRRWSDEISRSSNEDSFTGGRSIWIMYKNAIGSFYTLPDGMVWRVRLQDGVAERCGTGLDHKRAATAFVSALVSKASPADIEKAAEALMTDSADVDLGTVNFKSAGTCLWSISAAAKSPA